MMRGLGLIVSYIISLGYVLLIIAPLLHCLRHNCNGPEGDAFMPAFFLIPVGGIATIYSLQNAIQQIKKRQSWSWVYWSLAVIFAIVLAGIVGFIGLGICTIKSHH